MSLQPRALRIAGGVGALLVCGGAGAAVAADQRPVDAPLKPPVSQGSEPVAKASPSPSVTPLAIPPTPRCSAAAGPGAAARRRRAGAACAPGSPAVPDGGAAPLAPSVEDAAGDARPLTFTYVS